MSVFREHVKNSISNRFGNEIDVFVSRKRFDYFAFKQPLLSYPFYKELFHFVGKKKKVCEIFSKTMKLFSHTLSVHSGGYMNLYFFRRQKKLKMSKKKSVFKDLCDKIVDVIHDSFTKNTTLQEFHR